MHKAFNKLIPIEPVAAVAPAVGEIALYEVRKKVYPRSVHGTFARWRWTLVLLTQLIYYGLPWLPWSGREAVLFDLAARKFYIFGLVFWPQDVIYLAVLLILSALALFLFTAVAGRLWCGYACPQTVYTEMFMWIERRIEGDRPARMRLDRASMSWRKLGLKTAKHAAWLGIAFWTGYTFVGYFTPIADLGVRVLTLHVGGWETFWILFYGFATYGNAGFMREQVCKYMCPYARFQSVMFDPDTLVITYDAQRGEPRGARSRKVDAKAAGLGACVDCSICVQVCPTGIDIRQGLQYECIGCAACIDACDQVMDRMGYAKGLIRYSTENALAQHGDARAIWRRVLRVRTLIYLALIAAIAAAAAASLCARNPLKVDVIRDRGILAREVQAGVVENVYRLQIMNTDEHAREFTVRASGIPGIEVVGVTQPIALEPASTRLVPLRLQARSDAESNAPAEPRGHAVTRPIEITIEAIDDSHVARQERSTFAYPR